MKAKILAIIPARGGSKGIPRKNLRLLGGIPLIGHAIRNCLGSKRITQTLVSTEDEEIAVVARRFGAEVLMRRPELAADEVPLAPVVYDVVQQLEKQGQQVDIVATVQPTSPLIRPETLDRALAVFDNPAVDTVLSVYDNTHLNWTIDEEGRHKPLFSERVNRQQLPQIFTESGGIIAARRTVITEKERIGDNVELIVLDPEEATDIDTYHDWWLAEKILNRRRIVFNIVGSKETGLGHVYRARTLMHRLTDHEVLVIVDEKQRLAEEIMRNSHFTVHRYSGSPIKLLEELKPDIVVNDILDTDPSLIMAMKDRGWRVVNFEDGGDGIKYADEVINALYEVSHPSEHVHTGCEYYCLREEFLFVKRREARREVENVLICFGGTDPCGLTVKVVRAMPNLPASFKLSVIVGAGFDDNERLATELSRLKQETEVVRDTKVISHYMEQADVMVTSGGRTVYEAATIGVPTIVLCQNERELKHVFASQEYGFINLGLGSEISEEKLVAEIKKLIEDWELRRQMQYRMWRWDGRQGTEKVVDIILGKQGR